jgi:hypothetical protein
MLMNPRFLPKKKRLWPGLLEIEALKGFATILNGPLSENFIA